MTEYDDSPAAYEQYLSKQRAITRWVDEANQYTPVNPFLPSELPPPPDQARGAAERNYDSDSDYEHSGSRRRRHSDRDERHRSQREDPHRSHSSKRRSKSSVPSSLSYTQRTSPYTSLPPDQQHPYSYPSPYNQPQQHPHNYRTNARPYTYPSKSSTPTPQVYAPQPPRVYSPSPSQQPPIVVPIRGGTRGYVVVPPPGVAYQVVHPQQPQSPSQTQPWYKRVFSPTASVNSGTDKLAKSSSSSSRKRRSSRKWEWDIY